ncbi:peptide ABC transporter substrate-binding protein [Bifidobacterium bombi]|uniref:Oligopeptide ABC transporter, solute-binding protein n=1 Tax=Bifidobacterium bombi DSM 19703 TaxID=1341695 RepID=A0A080N2Y2_9BIFI|nr:ABC transporter substrate-binding protein [Bifidobacterium bombi]KFF31407.1 oligopeptide ABC transporter, solute-binding protein [Bifidobacterium bombi DSM 19703]
MKKKTIAFAAAVCSLALSLGACGSSSNGSSASAGNGKMIITGNVSEPQNPLIPGNTNESGGGRVLRLIFSQLVAFDAKGNAMNDQAESIKPDAAGTQYTIKIKPGLKFSDGTPIKAESFTKAWSYVADVKNAQKCASFFSSIKGYDDVQKKDGLKGDEQLSGLKVVNDTTFTVDLQKPDATFPIKVGYSAFAPLPDSFYKDPKGFGQKPVGNGPYKLVKWDHNNAIETVKNPNYSGPEKVKNDGVTLKVYTKDDAAYADVQAGNLDSLDIVPAADTKTFEKDSSIQAYNKPGSVIQEFTIPANIKHFESGTEEGTLRRQAISMAIDRKAIVNKVLSGVGAVPHDFTSPLTPGYDANLKGSSNLEYNPTKAKELWAKADAISKDNDKLTMSYNSDGGAKPVFDAMVNSINNALGVDVASANPVPTFQQFRDSISNRKMTGAFRSGWMPDYPSAENYLYQCFSSAAADGNGSNDGDYKNPEFDKLMDEAYAAKSADQANKFYSQSQEILLNDLPAIPIYYKNNDGVAAKGVKGFAIDWQSYPTYSQMTK